MGGVPAYLFLIIRRTVWCRSQTGGVISSTVHYRGSSQHAQRKDRMWDFSLNVSLLFDCKPEWFVMQRCGSWVIWTHVNTLDFNREKYKCDALNVPLAALSGHVMSICINLPSSLNKLLTNQLQENVCAVVCFCVWNVIPYLFQSTEQRWAIRLSCRSLSASL